MQLFDDFRKFAVRGNVADMAVGIIIGSAFTAVVNSLVGDIMTPPLGMVIGNADFTNLFVILKEGTTPGPFATLAEAQASGAVLLKYGLFLNKLISFATIAFSLFFLITAVTRTAKKIREATEEDAPAVEPAAQPAPTPPPEPTTKECPFCFSTIPIRAVRCPQCTSVLEEPEREAAPESTV